MYRFIISLRKLTHQIWHDHPFTQRNRTSKTAAEVKVAGKEVKFENEGEERFGKN